MRNSVFDIPALDALAPQPQQQPAQVPAQPARPVIDPASAMMAQEMPDPYEVAKPTHLSLMNAAAKQTGEAGKLDAVMSAAYKGMTPEQMTLMRSRQEIDRKTEEVLAKTANLDDTRFNDLLNRMDALTGQMRGRKAPTRKAPEYDWASAIGTGLAMLVDPGGAGTYAAAYGQGMRNRADDVLKMDQAEFQAESDALEMQYKLTAERARLEEQRMEQRRKQFEDTITRELNVLRQQGATVDKQIQYVGDQVAKAQARYNAANLPEEKRVAAAALAALGVPVDKDSIERDVQMLTATLSQSARSAWNTQVNQLRDDFGEVPETAVAQLEAQRRELAAMYGVSEDVFAPIPTGRTLAAQRFEQSKAQFDKMFGLRSEQFKQKVSEFNANLALAKQRLAVMQQNAATSRGNLGVRMQELEYRKVKDAADGISDVSAKEITKLENEIRKEKGKRALVPQGPNIWMSEEAKAAADKDAQKLRDLESELAMLKMIRQQAIEESKAATNVLGGGNNNSQKTQKNGSKTPKYQFIED